MGCFRRLDMFWSLPLLFRCFVSLLFAGICGVEVALIPSRLSLLLLRYHCDFSVMFRILPTLVHTYLLARGISTL